MIMKELLLIIIPSIVSSVLTWFFYRKKYVAETQTNELDNVQKALAIYRDTILDLKTDLEDLRKKITEVVEENEALGKQMEELRKELKCTRTENKRFLAALKQNNINITDNET